MTNYVFLTVQTAEHTAYTFNQIPQTLPYT